MIGPMAKHGTMMERTCIVTGGKRPQAEMLRFVAGPKGEVVPDIAHTLPGRGIWVENARKSVETAVRKGLFSRACRKPVPVDTALAERVGALLKQEALGLLGVARKCGALTTGFEKVKFSLYKDPACLYFEASDAGHDGKEKLAKLAKRHTAVRYFTGEELSLAMGKDHVVYAAVTDEGLAKNCLRRIARWQQYETDSTDE